MMARYLVSILIIFWAFPALAQSTPDPDATAKVLAANTEFYRAFRERDHAGMAAIWGRQEPITVIHPGWPTLNGRRAVINSWRRSMSHSGSPEITFKNPRVRFKDGHAVVRVDELIAGAILPAINLYRRENGVWKIIHHAAVATRQSET